MYVYTTNTDKNCGLLQHKPVFPSGRTPHDKQNRNCLDLQPKAGHVSQRGSMPTQSNSDSDSRNRFSVRVLTIVNLYQHPPFSKRLGHDASEVGSTAVLF
jgi:hypothetical protein